MLQAISESNQKALQRLSRLEAGSDEEQPETCISENQPATAMDLQRLLCGETTHSHSLKLVNEITNPAFKGRHFSVLLQIVDYSGEMARLNDTVQFKLMAFSNENPPKPVKFNTYGEEILKGTIETQGISTVFFRKLAIKEVTSHFRGGSLFFVVMPIDAEYIKPFIVENFVVKARKTASETNSRKKVKLEE